MSMDTATLLFDFLGTAAVAILAGLLGWWVKRSEWKRDIFRQKVATRERLYADFLAETDRLILMGMDEKYSQAISFHQMSRFFSEIEFLSSSAVVEAARDICAHVFYVHEVNALQDGSYAGLKKAFIVAARHEINGYER